MSLSLNKKQIYLLSAPSGYGKTTALSNWIAKERHSNGTTFGGILQIVINGQRHIRFLSTDIIKQLQFNESKARTFETTSSQHISCEQKENESKRIDSNLIQSEMKEFKKCGHFLVRRSVLEDCRTELRNAFKYDWIIIDEIGCWELLKNEGYEPAVSEILNAYARKNAFANCKFVIVIRPSLKKRLFIKYGIAHSDVQNFETIYNWNYRRNWPLKMIYSAFIICTTFIIQRNRNRT